MRINSIRNAFQREQPVVGQGTDRSLYIFKRDGFIGYCHTFTGFYNPARLSGE